MADRAGRIVVVEVETSMSTAIEVAMSTAIEVAIEVATEVAVVNVFVTALESQVTTAIAAPVVRRTLSSSAARIEVPPPTWAYCWAWTNSSRLESWSSLSLN